jgi:hypothetical protein
MKLIVASENGVAPVNPVILDTIQISFMPTPHNQNPALLQIF